MNFYRILFFKTKLFSSHHTDTTAEFASHYHVYKNSNIIAEIAKLDAAIKIIIDDLGGSNAELEKMIKQAKFISEPNPNFQCYSIIYTDKFGAKLEIKLIDTELE